MMAHRAEAAHLMVDKQVKKEGAGCQVSFGGTTPLTYFLQPGCLPHGGQETTLWNQIFVSIITWVLRIKLGSSDSCSKHVSH